MIWALIAAALHIIENVLIAHTIQDIHPAVFAAVFYFFSSGFLAVYHVFAHKREQPFDVRKALSHKALIAGYAGGAVFGNILWYTSLYVVGLGATAFVLVFIRVIVAGYSYFFMDDRFPLDRMVAFLTGFVALLLFSFSGDASIGIGVIFAFLSCFCFSSEVICKKKLAVHGLSGTNMVLVRNMFSLLAASCIAVGAFVLGYIEPEAIAISAIPIHIIALAALLGGVLTNVFSFFAMKSIQLSQFESLETMKPFILAICGVAFLGEEMALIQFFYGGVIVLSSVYFLAPKHKIVRFLRGILKKNI